MHSHFPLQNILLCNYTHNEQASAFPRNDQFSQIALLNKEIERKIVKLILWKGITNLC